MSKRPGCVWCGIDGGKGHHWAAVVDETGTTVWSKKIDNDESAILTALGEILDLADEVRWAVDISGTPSALLLALLAAHGQQAVYVPGRTVNRMAGAYRGEAKTDARDAYVIAETARHRGDLATIGVPVQLAADLTLLTSHRTDLVADRVRLINRLRDVLTGIFPALERAFDPTRNDQTLPRLEPGHRLPRDRLTPADTREKHAPTHPQHPATPNNVTMPPHAVGDDLHRVPVPLVRRRGVHEQPPG
ncbi:transposase [Streptomyces sp. V4I8]